MVLGLLCRVGSDGIITSTDNVDDGENYEDDVGTLAHRHTGTQAHWHTGTLTHWRMTNLAGITFRSN